MSKELPGTMSLITAPTLQAPREPAIERSPATTNLKRFFKNLDRFSIDPDARFEHTLAEERTKHVLDCLVHDNRNFELCRRTLASKKQHIATARKTKAWHGAYRSATPKDPDNILQPFRLNSYVEKWYNDKHGPKSVDTSDGKTTSTCMIVITNAHYLYGISPSFRKKSLSLSLNIQMNTGFRFVEEHVLNVCR